MLVRGKHVLVVMAALIAVAVGFQIWFRADRTKRVRALWGHAAVDRCLNAPMAELFSLSADGTDGGSDLLTVGGATWRITRRKDITHDPAHPSGVLKIREALMLDATYDWDGPARPADMGAEPPVAFAFHAPDGHTVLLVDCAVRRVTLVPDGPSATLTADFVPMLREYIEKQLPAQSK